ncbi:Telomerase activating protein Est1 [Ceratocystis platani]|uniref:Telomerase activating protein Est1 n=1 Tax=Ceratocystis fimbriata f. sp. platani TaxID=88771 RepID=A0A0F8BL60_CERFI|nr:Telomerase activating protein Est1 [Ceratocystis platani]
MPTVVENAEVALAWKEACKLRKSLVKHIDRLIESNATANDKKTFDKVEDYVAKFRLSCMQIIFADFVYATENHVQRDLWEAQLHVSKLYRAVIRESRGQHVALRRIEKRYAGFLNLCQLFYEGYVQRLATAYELPVLANIAHRLNPNPNDKSLGGMIQPSDLPKELLEMVIAACHDALIALGDLARYHLKLKGKMNLYESAVSFYSLANDLNPAISHGHHGIGLASVEVSKHFLVVYHMYRAVVAQEPHPNAMNNLATEFSHLRDPNASLATKDPSPQQVLEIIFVRLHAYFFVGNEMPKRDELEQAFFRRLEEVLLTIKPDEFSNILCMAIVNISACAVAKEKCRYTTDPTFPLTYAVLPGRKLAYAVDDKILPHAKDFDLGTGPSSKFPVCVSAIEELAPSQPTTPMNKDVETMEPEPEKIHSGKPANHMMDDNSQPYSSSPLDGSRKIPALEWSSVYTPKPAGGAWKQLTADQYYSAQNVEHRQQLLNTLLDGAASGITPASSPHLTSGYLQSMTPFQQSQQPVDPPPGFGNISSSTPFLHSSNIFQGTPQQLQPRNMVMASPTTMTGSQFESYQQQQQYMHARQQYSSSLNATENTTSNPPPGFSSGSYNPR